MNENKFWILFWIIFFTYFVTDNYIGYLDRKTKSEHSIKMKELEIQNNSAMRDYVNGLIKLKN